MAQINPANYGTNAVAIVGKQTVFENQVAKIPNAPGDGPKMRAEIVELRPPMTLQPVRGFYRADRMKGSPSPDPMVPGMEMGGGDVNFFADPHTLAFWLGELLMYDPSTSLIGFKLPELTDPILAGASAADHAAYTSGVAFTTFEAANQPGQQLADDSPVTATRASDSATVSVALPSGLRAARLIFTFDAAATGARTIDIEGTDHNDTHLFDRITRADITKATTGTDAMVARVMKSSKWIKKVTSVTITDGAGATSGKVRITADPETYFHRLKFTKAVNEGLTIEVHEGNVDTPTTYAGAHIGRGVLSIEQVVRAMFRITANRAFPRRSITGSRDGTALTKANGFTRAKPNFIPDWGMSWTILDQPGIPDALSDTHRLATGNFIIDNLLAPPATRFAETTRYPKNVRKGNRDLMLAVQVDHHKDLDFDQFVGADSFQSVFSAVSRQFGQRYQAIRFSADNTQIVAFPSRPIMNLAEVLANLAIRMNIGDEGDDEATLEIFNDSASL